MDGQAAAQAADLASAAGGNSDAETEPAGHGPPAAPILVEVSAEPPSELGELALRDLHRIEATAGAAPATPPERERPSPGETEGTPEVASSAAAPAAEPERTVGEASARPSAQRRGWWQRLIQP